MDRGGRVVVSREAIRKAERMDGRWVLMTNDDTLSVEDAATGYKNLLVIERCFRTMKTAQIRMDPVYHFLPRRIEAHVKICALALLLERAAERTVGMPWRRIREALGHLQATEYRTDTHRFFQRNEVQPEVRRIPRTLKDSRAKLGPGHRADGRKTAGKAHNPGQAARSQR